MKTVMRKAQSVSAKKRLQQADSIIQEMTQKRLIREASKPLNSLSRWTARPQG